MREESGKRTKLPLFLHVPLFLQTLLIKLRPQLPEGKSLLGQHFISQSAPVIRSNLSMFVLYVSYETRTTERRGDIFLTLDGMIFFRFQRKWVKMKPFLNCKTGSFCN